MTDRPPRRILQRLGTTLVVAGMASGSLGQRGHQATGDFMLDRSVTIVVSSDEPQPVRLAAEDLAGDFAEGAGHEAEYRHARGGCGAGSRSW